MKPMTCPCGAQKEYSSCCEPYIKGQKAAPTAETLMRSRYTAHVKNEISYLRETLAAEKRNTFDEKGVKEWAAQSEWLGLKILSTKQGLEPDKRGVVEFTATYKVDGKTFEHHEVSQFKKSGTDGRWYFVDGESHTHEEGKGHDHGDDHEPAVPVTRESPKIGRNDPCSCGSGKKYKKCCGI